MAGSKLRRSAKASSWNSINRRKAGRGSPVVRGRVRPRWTAISAKSSEQYTARDIDLSETVNHELVHFSQIVTMGYLYRLAVGLFEQIKQCIPQSLVEMPGADLKPPPHVSARLAKLLAALDLAGPFGMTIRMVVESQAFYIQKRSNWQGLNHYHFNRMLDTVSGPEYRYAYDFTMKHLGRSAFETFPILSSLALCAADPARSFVELVLASSERKLTYSHGTGPMPFAELANEVCKGLLGTSAEMAGKTPRHPIYTPVVSAINELCGKGGTSVLVYFAEPHLPTSELVNAIVQPLLFNRSGPSQSPLFIPSVLWTNKTLQEKKDFATSLLILAAISATVLGNVEMPH